jgi:RNA polymerase sigma-70 factor (ECF subfamily)
LAIVTQAPLPADAPSDGEPAVPRQLDDVRLREMVAVHYEFVWRSLRRLGIHPSAVDDVAQEVFWIVARKLECIEAGAERAYLFGIVVRLASDARRRQARSRETHDSVQLDHAVDTEADVERLVDQKRARDLLDTLLDQLPLDLRTVLMLTEGEQLTMLEIANLLAIPPGTVASRLRRAREAFESAVDQLLRRRGVPEDDDQGT